LKKCIAWTVDLKRGERAMILKMVRKAKNK